MSTTYTAKNITIIHQGNENGCTKAYRCEIKDPYTNLYGTGYGDSPREALNDAKVDLQDNAASFLRTALKDADEGFERLLAQTSVIA